MVVLCVESRLAVEEIGEASAETTGQNEQFFSSGCGQFLVEIVVDPNTPVVAQSVDILLAQSP